MAYTESSRSITAIVGSAITKNRFVSIAADGQIDHAGTAQGNVDGVSGMTEATVGETVPMNLPDGGVVKIELGATLAVGALVATSTTGTAIAAGSVAGNIAWGKLLEAGVSGDVVAMQFTLKNIDPGT